MYELRIRDDRINAYRVIRGEDRYDVQARAAAVQAAWDERCRRKQALEESRRLREEQRNILYDGAQRAQELTSEVQSAAKALDTILIDGCDEPSPTWESLKHPPAIELLRPHKPKQPNLPKAPVKEIYEPVLTLSDKLIPGRKAKKIGEARERYEKELRGWQSQVTAIKGAADEEEAQYRVALEAWRSRKSAHEDFIDSVQKSYGLVEKSSVEYLVSEALYGSVYPESFPIGFDLSFNPDAKTIVLDYELPNLEALPQHREVKYVAKRRELQYVPVTETWRKATYDKLLYQMALRTIHRVFAVDKGAAVLNVVFNGWVKSIDPATGSEAHGCILSVQAGRDEFTCLDLRRVDPKACFKSLKGVGSSRLTDLTPIRPIVKLNKEDARFVEAYGVVEGIDERTNLAGMDWQDFENLIREIFEKEFSSNGGEVKITQASRDGGVDAVAFDNDPLRGGKIVIQAKRYTNTVGVSAVRDLYGTVQHEGAMKGILVTTATFGSDAYEFARDKPITLISGAELLGLLERHGHKAKINLAEARVMRQLDN
jgi:restriction system protein